MEKQTRDIFNVHPEAFSDFPKDQLQRIEEREEE